MNWNDERVELLRKLWAEGLSASQIAAQLGGVSRNAVIGKVHRLKLSSRGRATRCPRAPEKGIIGGQRRQDSHPRGNRKPVDAGVDRRNRAADAVRGGAGRPASYPPGRKRRGSDLAPPAARSTERAHLQVAEWRPTVGGFQLLRQRQFRRALLHISLEDRVSTGVRAAPPSIETRQSSLGGHLRLASKPAVFSEPPMEEQADDDDDEQHHLISERHPQFRHIFEVHAVDPCHCRRHGQDRRP